MSVQQEIVELTKKLIEFPTTSDNNQEINHCMDFIDGYFMPYKLIVKRYEQKGVKPCMVVSFSNKREFKFFFNGHIDVVDAPAELFKPKIKGTKLLGRGTVDMKAAVATYMVIMKNLSQLKNQPSVALMIVSDEEVGGMQGTNFLLNKRNYTCDFAITGESSLFNVEIMHKKSLILKIKVNGKSCHGSRPWKGDNAIEKLMDIYSKVKKKYNRATKKRQWNINCSITNMQSLSAPNTIPSGAEAILDLRLTEKDSTKQIISFIKTLGAEVEIYFEGSILNTSKENKYVQNLKNISEEILDKKVKFTRSCGGSDTQYFTENKIPAVNFGPTGGKHHTNEEYVRYKLLGSYYKILEKFILENAN